MIVEDFSEHDHSHWLCEYDASYIFSITEHLSSRGNRKATLSSDTDESYERPLSASDMVKLKSEPVSFSEVSEGGLTLSFPVVGGELFVNGLVISEPKCGLEALYFTDSLVKSVSNKGHFAQLSLTTALSNSDCCDVNVCKTQPFKSVLSGVEDLRAKRQTVKNHIQSKSLIDKTAYITVVNDTDKKAAHSQTLSEEHTSSGALAGSSLLLSEHLPYSPTDNGKAERQYLNPASDGKDNNDVNNLSSCRDKKCVKRFTVTNIGKDVEDVVNDFTANVAITESVICPKEDVVFDQTGDNVKEDDKVIMKPSLVRTHGSGLPRLLKAPASPASPRVAGRTLPTPPISASSITSVSKPNPFFPQTTTRHNFTPLKLPEKLNLSMKPDLSMKSEPRSEPKSDLSMNTKSKTSLLNRLRAVHAHTKTVDIELEEEVIKKDDDMLFKEVGAFEEEEEDEDEVVDADDEEDLSDVLSDREGKGKFPTTCLSAIEEVESNSPSSTSDRTINKHVPTLRTEGSERSPHAKKPEETLSEMSLPTDDLTTHRCEECPSCGEVSKLIHGLAKDTTSMGSNEKHTEFEASWKKMKVLIKKVLSTKDSNCSPCKACSICNNMCGIIHKFKLSQGGNLRDTKESIRAEYANVIKDIDPGTSVLLDTCSTMSNKPAEVKQTKKLSSFANDVFNELCGILKTNQSKKARWFEEMNKPSSDVKDLSSSEFDTPTENICDDTSAGLNTIPLYEAADTYNQVKPKKKTRSSKSPSSLNTLSDDLKNDLIDKINVAISKEVDSMKKDLANRILKSLSLSVGTPDLKSIKEGIRTDNELGMTSWTEGLSSSFSSSSPEILKDPPLRNDMPNLYIPLEVSNNITPVRKPTKYDLIKQHAEFSTKSNSSTSNKSNPQFKQAQMKHQSQLRPNLTTPSASLSAKKPINVLPKIRTPSSSINNDSKSSSRKRKCLKKKVPKSQRSKQLDNKIEAILTSITGITNKNNKKLSRSKKSLNGFFVESGSETESTMTSSESSLDLNLNSREVSIKEDDETMCSTTSFSETTAGINKFNNVLDSFKVQKKVVTSSSSEATTTVQEEAGVVKLEKHEKDDNAAKPAFKCYCCTWEEASLISSESCPHPPQHVKKPAKKHQQKEQIPHQQASPSSSSSDTGGITDDFTAHTVFHSAKVQQTKKGVSQPAKTLPKKIKLDLPRSLTKNSSTSFVMNRPVRRLGAPQTPGEATQGKPGVRSIPKVSGQILKKLQNNESAIRSVGKPSNVKQLPVQPHVSQQIPKPAMISKPTTHSKPLLQIPKSKSQIKPHIAPKQYVQPKQIPQIRQVTQRPPLNQNMPQPKPNPHSQIPSQETPRIFYKTPNARGSFKQYGSLQNLSQSTQSNLKESNPSLNKSAGHLNKNIPQPITRTGIISTQSAGMPLSRISTPNSSRSSFRREFNITSLSKGITANSNSAKPSTNYHGANLIKSSSLDISRSSSRITNVAHVNKSRSIDMPKTNSAKVANTYGSNINTSVENMNNIRKYEKAAKRSSESNLSGIKFPGSRNYKLK